MATAACWPPKLMPQLYVVLPFEIEQSIRKFALWIALIAWWPGMLLDMQIIIMNRRVWKK